MLDAVRTSPRSAVCLAAMLLVASCTSGDPGVRAVRSDGLQGAVLVPSGSDLDYDVTAGVIDFGARKPERSYDGFLTAVVRDVEDFWDAEFPAAFGSAWESLGGGVYAGWADRADPIPPCGDTELPYPAIRGAGALYCTTGDFIAYDDDELLPGLLADLGQEAIGIVIAHEYGHAVQSRTGGIDAPTILKEQQADCFAGAWAARVAGGSSELLRFDDADIRGALIAMIQIRDPLEIGGLANPDAHGTGFDRVGAFQDGFTGGVDECVDFLDPSRLGVLVDIPFQPADPNSGNLPLVDPSGAGSDIVTLIPASLRDFWTAVTAQTGVEFTPPRFVAFPTDGPYPDCGGLSGEELALDVTFCPASNTVVWDADMAAALAADPLTGDLSVGFLFAAAYADAVQLAAGSTLAGEARSLTSDCLAGAWVASIAPPTSSSGSIVLSAGDLDEAVITVISRSDPATATDLIGSAFERISALRAGVLNGLSACAVSGRG